MKETTETEDHNLASSIVAGPETYIWEDSAKAAEREGERVAKILLDKFKRDLEVEVEKQLRRQSRAAEQRAGDGGLAR